MFDTFYGSINGQDMFDDNEYFGMGQEDEYTHSYARKPPKPAPKILEGEIKRETDKAILFKFGESENWMPKSQVKIKKKKEGCSVEIPEWLWKRMTEEIEEND